MTLDFACPFAVAGVLFLAAPARAVDRWEAPSPASPAGDNDFRTMNEPRHGDVQVGHDFHSATDADWVRIRTHPRRSYEVLVSSGSIPWMSGTCPTNDCATLAMVNAGGTVLNPGNSDGAPSGAPAGFSRVSWGTGELVDTFYLRALSNTGLAGLSYDLSFHETTMFLPRFNNSGTQVTVVVVQNTHPTGIAGHIHFYDGSGVPLHSEPFLLSPNASLVFPSHTIPALANKSGSATIAHTARYGGIAGKAVAVEPATGFTFDTAFTPIAE
jgi:hypothetical protein